MDSGRIAQDIRYCTPPGSSDRLAYAVIGRGDPIVRTSHWMTHIAYDLSSPVWAHVLLGLAQHHTVVRYDSRGEGLSGGPDSDVSFEQWLQELETVVDAAGCSRFTLFGASQGAATAIAYAVRHPERVSGLILYGGFARGFAHWTGQQTQEVELALRLIREGWGSRREAYRQWFTSLFIPGGTAEQYRWYNEMQRVSASPETAARHLRVTADMDVGPLLERVTVPTLVLHSRGDLVVPFAMGEELARRIPGARFVPLEGDNHLFLAGSSAHRQFLGAVADFLGDPPPKGPLPGAKTRRDRLEQGVRAVEQNWLVKIVLLVGAVVGLALSLLEIWKRLKGG